MAELILTSVDVETTGFNADKGDRITEIALQVLTLDTDTLKLTDRTSFNTLVNPERAIPEEVQRITNITPALVKDCPTWPKIAPAISKVMKATDILVAHNAEFDSIFIATELMRLGLPLNMDMQIFCTMENGRFATPLGKCPKLIELCWALGVEFKPEDAHRAIYDTQKMTDALKVGIAKGYFDLTETIKKALETKTLREAA